MGEGRGARWPLDRCLRAPVPYTAGWHSAVSRPARTLRNLIVQWEITAQSAGVEQYNGRLLAEGTSEILVGKEGGRQDSPWIRTVPWKK